MPFLCAMILGMYPFSSVYRPICRMFDTRMLGRDAFHRGPITSPFCCHRTNWGLGFTNPRVTRKALTNHISPTVTGGSN